MTRKIFHYSILTLMIVSMNTVLSAQTDLITKNLKKLPMESFKHSDVGNPVIAGTVKIIDGGFDIVAGGADVWGVKDEFNFVYIEQTGDFDIAARIESLTAPNLYTKAGLMAREDLTPGCRHIYFQVFPNNNPRNHNNGGFEFQYRQNQSGEMKAIYPPSSVGTPEFPVAYPNTWIRLKREKNDFKGYYSIDGKNWKLYTTYSLELPEKIYLGPAVTSHNVKESVTAKFRDIGELKK